MKNKGIPYFIFKEDEEGKFYSIDKWVIKGNINPKHFTRLIRFLRKKCECGNNEYSNDIRLYHYFHFFQLFIGKSSMQIQISLNGCNKYQIKIDFTPNKLMEDIECTNTLIFIRCLCVDFHLQSIDLAIDIKVAKRLIHLIKTNYKNISFYIPSQYKGRKGKNSKHKVNYEKITKDTENFETEYFGSRNNKGKDGCAKLYNKTIEMMAKYGDETPLADEDMVSRFEITIHLNKSMSVLNFIAKLKKKLPNIYTFYGDTDFSQYADDKFFKKYENHIRTLNDSDKPIEMLDTLKNSKGKKYSKELKAKILKILNIHYITLDYSVIEDLYNDYLNLFYEIYGYEYEDITDNPDLFDVPIDVLDEDDEIIPFDFDNTDTVQIRKEIYRND